VDDFRHGLGDDIYAFDSAEHYILTLEDYVLRHFFNAVNAFLRYFSFADIDGAVVVRNHFVRNIEIGDYIRFRYQFQHYRHVGQQRGVAQRIIVGVFRVGFV